MFRQHFIFWSKILKSTIFYKVKVLAGLDEKAKVRQPETETKTSENFLEPETRPEPLRTVLGTKTDLQFQNTS